MKVSLVDERYRNADRCLTVFATNAAVSREGSVIATTRYAGYLESRLLDGRFRVLPVGQGDVRPSLRWDEERR